MLRRLLLLVIAAVLASCSHQPALSGEAWDALRQAKEVELVSLNPVSPERPSGDMLYYWSVTGRAKSTSRPDREKLVQALETAMGEEPIGAGCFMPRHAIVVVHGGHTYEFLVCFSCGYADWYVDHVRQERLLIGGAQHTVFDAVYRAAGLEIAK